MAGEARVRELTFFDLGRRSVENVKTIQKGRERFMEKAESDQMGCWICDSKCAFCEISSRLFQAVKSDVKDVVRKWLEEMKKGGISRRERKGF